jgi:L-2-amino-thiazoline-4-carboxylic acid hydrolase
MSEDRSKAAAAMEIRLPALEISTLKRREIQGPLIAGILAEFIDEIGFDKTMEVASKAIRADALKAGEAQAGKYGGNTINLLHRLVKEVWAAEDALAFEVLEQTEQRLSFNVTRCRYAELYEKLGIKEFGLCLSCNRDEGLIQGFNPRMKLIRTQTIMQGAESCDFRIELE